MNDFIWNSCKGEGTMKENKFVLNLDETIKGFDAKDIELKMFIIPETFRIGIYRESHFFYDIFIQLELTTKDERYLHWKYTTLLIYRYYWEYKNEESCFAEYLLEDSSKNETCAVNKIIFNKEDYLHFVMTIARGSVSDMLSYMHSLEDIHPESIKYILKKEKIAEKIDYNKRCGFEEVEE